MQGLFLTLSLFCFGLTYGYSRFKREIPNGYGVQHPCPDKGHWDAVGHMTGGYTPQKNVFGLNFRDGGKMWTEALCRQDSDGDGLTNGEELGDPFCKWRRGDQPPGPVKGHPGFCEPDRAKCDSGMTHAECPNPHARGNGRGSGQGNARTVPPRANDHPQTFLSKNLGQNGGMGQDLTGFSIGRPSFPGDNRMSQSVGDRFGMSANSFDRSVSSDFNLGGQSHRQSAGFESPAPPSFQPTARPGFSSFNGRSDSGVFTIPSLSQDFGVPSGQFIESPSSGFDRMSGAGRMSGMERTSGMGRPSDTFIPGRMDYPMQAPGMDRFSSSLDQRSIQGMGSPSSGPSFQSSMTQGDIERSVQARMDSVRSRFGDSRQMGLGIRPDTMGFNSETRGTSSGGILTSRGRGFVGSMGPDSTSSSRGMMAGSGSFAPMSPSGVATGFSGAMEGYPPFISGGSPGFGGTSFSSEGSSMPGASFPGRMMEGPVMFRGGPSASMMGPPFSRF